MVRKRVAERIMKRWREDDKGPVMAQPERMHYTSHWLFISQDMVVDSRPGKRSWVMDEEGDVSIIRSISDYQCIDGILSGMAPPDAH